MKPEFYSSVTNDFGADDEFKDKLVAISAAAVDRINNIKPEDCKAARSPYFNAFDFAMAVALSPAAEKVSESPATI